MFISTSQNNVNFVSIEVKNFNQLIRVMCDDKIKAYSFSTYKENYRNKNNFISMRCVGLDIDNDKNGEQLSLKSAIELFKDYKHIIATTRSHQKEKHGVVADRFRVVLFFENDLTTSEEFVRTWQSLNDLCPAIDPACKDVSRYWFPSGEVVQVQKTGKFVDVPEYVEPECPEHESADTSSSLGKLSYNTTKFFCQGEGAGSRHRALFKASVDCREQGYTADYVKSMVQSMIEMTGQWEHPTIGEHALKTIADAYSRDIKYNKRLDDEDGHISYNFTHIKDTVTDDSIKTEWLVDGFLTVGGLSLFAGQPKSGKSTITRQLAIQVAQGKGFLNRDVKQGAVYYLAMEEQASMVKEQLIAQKVKLTDPIYIHYGPCSTDLDSLKNLLITNEVRLLIIDTMALFLNAEDLNSYDTINKMLKDLREVARESKCHITLIHHQNKTRDAGTFSIMGSNAIHGAVDNAIIFENVGKSRYISTSQRGGVRFTDTKLSFNTETQTYKIAKKQNDKGDDDDGF